MTQSAKTISNFNELLTHLKDSRVRRRLAVVWPEDDHTRDAVDAAFAEGFVEPILVCSAETQASCAGRYATLPAASPEEAAARAVELVREGKADMLMKGFVNTDVLLRAVLNKQTGILPPGNVLTHITAAHIPGYPRLLFFTDAAVIPFPTEAQRRSQLHYLADLCRAFRIECPRIALIHCSEKPDAKHFPYTEDYLAIRQEAAEGRYGRCIVDGPLDLKTSCSPEALRAKHIDSPVGGCADAVILPNIEAGNLFYKAITLFAQAETAAVLQGTEVPVVLPSRGDSVQSKLYSLALAAIGAG